MRPSLHANEAAMATVKRITDLTPYASVLPYASELFGIYQPLLGWKSKRTEERIASGLEKDKAQLLKKLEREFSAAVQIKYSEGGKVEIQIQPGELTDGKLREFDSLVLEKIGSLLPAFNSYQPSIWPSIITAERLNAILKKDVVGNYTKAFSQLQTSRTAILRASTAAASDNSSTSSTAHITFEKYLKHESNIAGVLLLLTRERHYEVLKGLFYVEKSDPAQAEALSRILSSTDSATALIDIEHMNPSDASDIKRVALSPISVVHLFRQYFFELDTFLGPSVQHVWLSPGSSVELYEVHTRRTTTEKTLESTLDVLTKNETETTVQDEISDAVKEENDSNIKFGASVTAKYATVEATSSFDLNSSQKSARETTHKRMRQQTDKLSTEIRKNFKTTFKTTTESIDVSSTRHLLANNTNALLNYELRRKMRQVGIQVQDIGTYLCWQTYVDDPGKSLGVAKLVHMAKPAELDAIPHPQELPTLQPFQDERIITIPFISVDGTNADNEGEVYVDGIESDNSEFLGSEERIQHVFRQEFVCPKLGFELNNVEFDAQGKPVTVSRRSAITNSSPSASFDLNLDSADFQGQNSLQVKVILHWTPLASVNQEIEAKSAALQEKFNAAEKEAFEKAAIETLKDRVNQVSKIVTRNSDELREEERIVIYRRLIQDMLQNHIEFPDDQTRHVVAELINSIFDVDKMLYFVSPEWWRPRLHQGRQQMKVTAEPAKPPVFTNAANLHPLSLWNGVFSAANNAAVNVADPVSSSTIGWGGINDVSRDNYYITNESDPARFGSSLGWLLQLDGDNMRNAFLNAPWVKAVIPIRPGKEEAAINWLKGVEGMNGITDDVIYHANNPGETDVNGNPLEGQKMIDVLIDLGNKIKRKYQQGIQTGQFPKASEVTDPTLADPANTVTATPIDRVYEHGFFPLQGSFRVNVGDNYEIFDQWIEVLPTDQVVPVEVTYDSKTGRQL